MASASPPSWLVSAFSWMPILHLLFFFLEPIESTTDMFVCIILQCKGPYQTSYVHKTWYWRRYSAGLAHGCGVPMLEKAHVEFPCLRRPMWSSHAWEGPCIFRVSDYSLSVFVYHLNAGHCWESVSTSKTTYSQIFKQCRFVFPLNPVPVFTILYTPPLYMHARTLHIIIVCNSLACGRRGPVFTT